jgi:hypothetical protein
LHDRSRSPREVAGSGANCQSAETTGTNGDSAHTGRIRLSGGVGRSVRRRAHPAGRPPSLWGHGTPSPAGSFPANRHIASSGFIQPIPGRHTAGSAALPIGWRGNRMDQWFRAGETS